MAQAHVGATPWRFESSQPHHLLASRDRASFATPSPRGKRPTVTPPAALLDVDGTLVDSGYHHAIAWFRAFREHGILIPVWRLHRHVGMGSDQFVAAVAGDEVEREIGDAVREAHSREFKDKGLIDEVPPLPGARELVVELKDRGHPVVLASSAKTEECEHYLELIGIRELVDDWTTSADVETTKPAPDIIQVALEKANGGPAVLVGDATWDCKAAERAGIETIGVLTGGFSEAELREAGAVAVFESLADLHEHLDETPLGARAGTRVGG
jgi:HAD superfamily hydrolase (TIGR01509 family)